MENLNLEGQTILLGVTGSIAAYKSADLCARLTEAGACVYPILSESACKFIQPLTCLLYTSDAADD